MSEIKKCPDCGSEMEKGYLFTDGVVIRWNHKKHKFFVRGELLETQIWNLNSIEAYRCVKCKLAFFYYGKLPLSETPKSFLKNCVRCGIEIPIASDYCFKCGAKQKD